MGLFTSPPPPHLGDPRRVSSTLVAGRVSTNQDGETPPIIGSCYFDSSRVLLPPQAYSLPWFRSVLEVSDPAATAYLDLYDPTGATTYAVPNPVPNSQAQCISTTPTLIEIPLWNLWGVSAIFQARLWVIGPLGTKAICSSATLDFDWS